MDEELKHISIGGVVEDTVTTELKQKFRIPEYVRLTLRPVVADEIDGEQGLYSLYRPQPYVYDNHCIIPGTIIRSDGLQRASKEPPIGFTCIGPSIFFTDDAPEETPWARGNDDFNLHKAMKFEIYEQCPNLASAMDALVANAIPVLVADKRLEVYYVCYHLGPALMDAVLEAYRPYEDDVSEIMAEHGVEYEVPELDVPLFQQRIDCGYDESEDPYGMTLPEIICTTVLPGAAALVAYNNFTFRPQRLFYLREHLTKKGIRRLLKDSLDRDEESARKLKELATQGKLNVKFCSNSSTVLGQILSAS